MEFPNELYRDTLKDKCFNLADQFWEDLEFQLAELEKLNHQFNMEKQMVGRKWLKEFLHRHPELSVREPEATSMSRAVVFNKPQVKRLFELLRAELEKGGGIRSNQIYNMDECGLTAVHTPGRIIAKKAQKQVGKITSAEHGKSVTVFCAVNAAGTFVPPLMIFPLKNMTELLIKDSPPGTIGAATISSSMD